MTALNKIDSKKHHNISTTIVVAKTPKQAFEAITNVRGWWTVEVEGSTDELGGEFTYRYKDMHYSKQRITEWVPGKRLAWLVIDSKLQFVADKREWIGTRMTFDIVANEGTTEVRFTHEGLTPSCECYDVCSNGWSSLIGDNLRRLIDAQPQA